MVKATTSRGQSLMEAIIAAGIMATSIASALTLVQSSLAASRESERGIVAGNLAREGIEVARAIRDSNWLSDASWDAGLMDSGEPLDYTAIAIFQPASASWSFDFTPDTLNHDMTVIYRHVTGSHVGAMVQDVAKPENTIVTPYRRFITLSPICDTEPRTFKPSGESCLGDKIGLRVNARVDWTGGGRQRHLEMTEDLYDWR